MSSEAFRDILLLDDKNILSPLELNTNLPELNIIWFLEYSDRLSGFFFNAGKSGKSVDSGICWVEVK